MHLLSSNASQYGFKNNIIPDTVICSSIGSIGISTAYCCKYLNLKCKIFASNKYKNCQEICSKFKLLNAELIFYGDNQSDCDDKAKLYVLKENNNAIYIPYSLDIDINSIYNYTKLLNSSFISYSKIINDFNINKLTSGSKPDCIIVPTTNGILLSGIFSSSLANNWQKNVKIIAAQLKSNSLFEYSMQNDYNPLVTILNEQNNEYLKHNAISRKCMYFAKTYKNKYLNRVKSIIIDDEYVNNYAYKIFKESKEYKKNIKKNMFGQEMNPSSIVAYAALLKDPQYFAQFQDILVIIAAESWVKIENNDNNDDEEKYQSNRGMDDDEDDNEYDSDDEEP